MGADGIRSVTRALIDPEAPRPRYVGSLNTAGYARGLDLGLEPGANHLVFGKRCFFRYVVHPDDDVPALAAIDHTERISTGWVTYDLPSLPTWHHGRMVPLGAAAHAVSPSAGQGASLATRHRWVETLDMHP